MHRSHSYSTIAKVSDDFSVDLSQGTVLAASSSSLKMATPNGLPIHRSVSDGSNSKKEIPFHGKSSTGQKVVHLIPVVLIFCGLVLWIFSHP
jgi:hypothetical protein